MQNIPKEHIDALIKSERLEAMGKMEYVTQEELVKHMERIFAEFDKAEAV